jgi:exosome complex RNA-binding protein Csl4
MTRPGRGVCHRTLLQPTARADRPCNVNEQGRSETVLHIVCIQQFVQVRSDVRNWDVSPSQVTSSAKRWSTTVVICRVTIFDKHKAVLRLFLAEEASRSKGLASSTTSTSTQFQVRSSSSSLSTTKLHNRSEREYKEQTIA